MIPCETVGHYLTLHGLVEEVGKSINCHGIQAEAVRIKASVRHDVRAGLVLANTPVEAVAEVEFTALGFGQQSRLSNINLSAGEQQ